MRLTQLRRMDGGEKMYKKMYLLLFNAITTALREIAAGRTDSAVSCLTCAQQQAEELFLNGAK